MRSIIEKAGGSRRFVSPSIASDKMIKRQSGFSTHIKEAAGLAFSLWALKRFPKTAILGLLGAGIYIGMNMSKDKNPFHGEGIVKNLH